MDVYKIVLVWAGLVTGVVTILAVIGGASFSFGWVWSGAQIQTGSIERPLPRLEPSLELTLVRGFFQASRFEDRTTLGNMSTVIFSPQEDGIASSPSVEDVTEETRHALWQELGVALQDVQGAEQDFRAEKKAYQDENEEAILRVVEAERKGEEVASLDEEIKTAWDQWRADERAFARKVSDAQNAVNEESRVAAASVYDPSNPINVTDYEGELVSKDVTVTASVEKDGQSADQRMIFTLQRVVLQGAEGPIEGRWIITAIEQMGAASIERPLPRLEPRHRPSPRRSRADEIRARCAREWPDSYMLRNMCVQWETDAAREGGW